MLAAGSMSPNMRTGIISLLFKDKGRCDDLRNYCPITVLYSLYKTCLAPWPSNSAPFSPA